MATEAKWNAYQLKGGGHSTRPRAKTFAQEAYDTAPDNYAVMDTLGWIMVHEGDISLGLTLLRNALARSANIPEIRYHYAVALHRNGQSKTAAKELSSLLAGAIVR
jgi:predicted Zn-dependent protease